MIIFLCDLFMNNLKNLRKEKNLLQKDIASILNMSQTGYSQYEVETHDIPTEILKQLALFYDVSVDYLLNITDTRNSYSKSIIKTENEIKKLNRLKEIREDRDLFQVDVAKLLNMSRSGYSQYETGANDIPTKVLKNLSYFYNVSTDYLLYITDDRKCFEKIKKEI